MLTEDSSWLFDSRLDVRVFLTSCGVEKQRYQLSEVLSYLLLVGRDENVGLFPLVLICKFVCVLLSQKYFGEQGSVFLFWGWNLGAVDQKPETSVSEGRVHAGWDDVRVVYWFPGIQ